MKYIYTITLITTSLILVMGSGCTQSTTTNTNETINTGGATDVAENTNTEQGNGTADTNTVTVTENINANTNVEVSDTNTNAADGQAVDTSDWLTYTNDEYGFSFKYPKEWVVVNDSNTQVSLRDKNLAATNTAYWQIDLSLKNNDTGLSLPDYYAKLTQDPLADIPNYYEQADPTDIKIDNIKAVQFRSIPGAASNTMTSVPLKDSILEISMHNDNVGSVDVYKKLLTTITIN